jgi:hypothetical protein
MLAAYRFGFKNSSTVDQAIPGYRSFIVLRLVMRAEHALHILALLPARIQLLFAFRMRRALPLVVGAQLCNR